MCVRVMMCYVFVGVWLYLASPLQQAAPNPRAAAIDNLFDSIG